MPGASPRPACTASLIFPGPRHPCKQAASFLASASPSNLAEGVLGVVAVAYLAPPLAKNAADRIRGYAGGQAEGGQRKEGTCSAVARLYLNGSVDLMRCMLACLLRRLGGIATLCSLDLLLAPGDILPSTAFDALVAQSGNILVDIRSVEEKGDVGVPLLPDMSEWEGGVGCTCTAGCGFASVAAQPVRSAHPPAPCSRDPGSAPPPLTTLSVAPVPRQVCGAGVCDGWG